MLNTVSLRNNDALIFDIDGTLWDATSATTKAWNDGLKNEGIERKITSEQVKSVTGNPNEICIDLLLPGLKETHPQLLKVLDQAEQDIIRSEGGSFYEGVKEGVPLLSKSYKIFLVSNCQDWYLEQFLSFSGFRDAITDADCHGKSKETKEEMLKKMMKKHSFSNPIYIGDTSGDMDSARRASFEFIGVSYGFGQITSEKMFDSFPSLLKYFKR